MRLFLRRFDINSGRIATVADQPWARQQSPATQSTNRMARRGLTTGALSVLAVAALAAGPLSPTGAALIDDFLLPEGGATLTLTTLGSLTNTQSGLGATAMGGRRDVTLDVTLTAGFSGASIKINNAPGGTAELNSDARTDSANTFEYGVGGDLNVDLLDGGLSDGFVIRINAADAISLSNTITVTTAGLGSSTATFVVPLVLGSPVDVLVPYASFIGTALFTDVDQIALKIDGPRAADYSIGYFGTTTEVPEPMSMGLLMVGSAMMLQRRRRAPAAGWFGGH